MVLMPSIPDSESSSGCVMALSITCAVAPLYTVRTDTTGGSMFGYSRTAMRVKDRAPTSTMMRLITVASTGRRMEMSDKTIETILQLVRHALVGCGANGSLTAD